MEEIEAADVARDRIKALYETRMRQRAEDLRLNASLEASGTPGPLSEEQRRGGLFQLKEIDTGSVPALIQCCIR